MGDVETLILVSTALAGFGAVVQHFYDRFASNGLYRRTERRAREIPAQIGVEVEAALNRVAEAQERKYVEAAKAAETGLHMSGVRQVGLEKAQMKELQGLMVEGIGELGESDDDPAVGAASGTRHIARGGEDGEALTEHDAARHDGQTVERR